MFCARPLLALKDRGKVCLLQVENDLFATEFFLKTLEDEVLARLGKFMLKLNQLIYVRKLNNIFVLRQIPAMSPVRLLSALQKS